MRKLLPLLLILPMSACLLTTTIPTSTSSPEPADTATGTVPTEEPTQPAPTPAPFVYYPEDPKNVVLDFTSDLCSAEWSNSGEYLPCPGNSADTTNGFSLVVYEAKLSDGADITSPALLMIPPHGSRFGGLFGAYPEINIYPGDHFKTLLACQESDNGCAVSYALHYYDANGNFYEVSPNLGPLPINNHNPEEDTWTEIDIDLSYLAGNTVRFILAVRTEGAPLVYPALWIGPHIQRQEGAQPAPTPDIIPTGSTDSTEESSVPGVIKGWVDMASAPPYLLDSYGSGSSTPVAVMFFNLDDGTWWWIHSTLTHPYYQMTVPPGDYHVVAYAQGVGDVAYVTGGYTGSDPSCGQALQVVHVPANTIVENIVIADWNWSCGGTAYRPEKPAEVPLP
ncbi:MAG: hypothetical protein JXA25_20665 [Anaerolineales bacterium]|nr:hypothetical protein [Anaerolineales bacterium]